jgi:multidrug resistance efflux pump
MRTAAQPVVPETDSASPDPALSPAEQGAVRLQNLLKSRFDPATQPAAPEPAPAEVPPVQVPAEAAPAAAPAVAPAAARRSPWLGRAVKVLLGLILVATFGFVPLMRLLQPSSVEAVVNARLVTVRAPIEGRLEITGQPLASLAAAEPGRTVIRIENPRVDRARLDDLARELARADDDRPGLERRIERMRGELARLQAQVEEFRQGRIRQLEARIAELDSSIAGSEAQVREADATLARGQTLSKTGSTSLAELERARRDRDVSLALKSAGERRRDGLRVELDAARRGVFIGDSYNDRPQSAQRAEEVAEKLAALEDERAALDLREKRLRTEVESEAERYAARSSVEVPLPTGRVWEVLAAPGEEVGRGQDLLRVLDCGNALVTATVTESVFNSLSLGQAARFQPSNSTESFDGTVVNLTGIAGPPGNLAIGPSALAKEPYRVTVAVPGLGRDTGCGVGRTGRVLFDKPL